MTPRRSTAPLLLAAALALPACSGPLPAGEPVTRVRDAAGVTSVVLETSGDLVVTLGETPRLEVTAGERVIDDLTSRTEDGTLHLGGSDVRGDVRYRLTTPSLASVAVRGSGTVRADLSAAPRPVIAVEGSGAVDAGGLDAESVTTALSGSGRVTLRGTAVTQTATVVGSGEYAASALSSRDATVTVQGSGSAEVHAGGTLDATVRGSGSITHRGGPRVEQDVDGSGGVSAEQAHRAGPSPALSPGDDPRWGGVGPQADARTVRGAPGSARERSRPPHDAPVDAPPGPGRSEDHHR